MRRAVGGECGSGGGATSAQAPCRPESVVEPYPAAAPRAATRSIKQGVTRPALNVQAQHQGFLNRE